MAYTLLQDDDDSYDPGGSLALRLPREIAPVRDEYDGTRFFVRGAGRRVATPLLAVAVEAADLVFAVDNVPAVPAVSDDAFIGVTLVLQAAHKTISTSTPQIRRCPASDQHDDQHDEGHMRSPS